MATHQRIKAVSLLTAQLITVAILILLWQWTSDTGRLDRSFFGSPSGVWETLRDWLSDGTILKHLRLTMQLMLAGLAVGTLLGVGIGILVGASDFSRAVLEPFLIFFNGMPRIVLQPFFIVWLGFGFWSRLALLVSVIVVLVAVSVASALERLDPELVANIELMGASRLSLIRQVYVPWLAVGLLANSRSHLGFAFQTALVAEFVGGASGLGYLIIRAQNTFNIDAMWAALLVVVVAAAILDTVIVRVQARATRWLPNRI